MADSDFDAYLVIADISGYTGLIKANAQVVRHAQYVISELLRAVLDAARVPLAPAKLEGDAVFFASPSERAESAVAGSLSRFFSAFDARRAALIAANTCPCHACETIGDLELKVVAHRGPVHRYRLQRFEELAGYDIIILHRLLKNTVEGRRYLLVTDAAWTELGLDGDAVEHLERYSDIGEVRARLLRPPPAPPSPEPAGTMTKAAELLRKMWKSHFGRPPSP